MKISDLDNTIEGKRVRVTHIAPSPKADQIIKAQLGYTDAERLVGQTGTVRGFTRSSLWAQLDIDWDNAEAGSLHLCDNDEIEVM